MKLQEKFENATIRYDANLNYVKNYEQIADDYALGFAKWSRENHIKYTVLGNVDSYKELLEIYKKTL